MRILRRFPVLELISKMYTAGSPPLWMVILLTYMHMSMWVGFCGLLGVAIYMFMMWAGAV